MDPELIRQLWEMAQRAFNEGVSLKEINAGLLKGAPELQAEAERRDTNPYLALRELALESPEPRPIPEFFGLAGRAGYPGAPLAAAPGPQFELTPEQRAAQRGLGGAFVRGTTLGLKEEIGALPRLLPGGQTFGEARQRGQERAAEFRRQFPGSAAIAELAGGLAIPGVGAAKTIPSTLSLPARMGLLGGAGAGFGAVAGAAEAPTLADVPRAALTGGGFGAALGATLPVAGELLSALRAIPSVVYASISPVAGGRRAAQQQFEQVGRIIGRSADDLREEFNAAQLLRAGDVAPADVDPLLKALTEFNAPAAGGRARVFVEPLEGRALTRPEALAQDVRRLSGFGRQTAAEAQELAEQRTRILGRSLFGPIERAHPRISDPRLDRLVDNEDVAAVWRKVRPRAGKQEPGFTHYQNLRTRLAGDASQAERAGNTAQAAALRGARDELTEVLNDIIPEFRAANLQFFQAQEEVRAFGRGAKAFTDGLNADEITQELAALRASAGQNAPQAVEAFRHGMVDEMVRKLLKQETGKPTLKKFAAAAFTADRRAGLRVAFGEGPAGQAAFEEFLNRAILDNRLTALQPTLGTGGITTGALGGGGVRAGLASPFVGLRFLILREMLRRGVPAAGREMGEQVLQGTLSRDPQAMERLLRLMGPGLRAGPQASRAAALTAAVPLPYRGLFEQPLPER